MMNYGLYNILVYDDGVMGMSRVTCCCCEWLYMFVVSYILLMSYIIDYGYSPLLFECCLYVGIVQILRSRPC